MRKLLYFAALSMVLQTGCSSSSGHTPVPPESAFCSTQFLISNPVTISGRAIYKRREFTAGGLGGVDATEYPIKHAEISVSGTDGIVQCGVTNTLGYFTMQVPKTSQNYLVSINSRSLSDEVKVSVLKSPDESVPHSLTAIVSGATDTNLATLTAQATGTLEGGAFNIYDQILNANVFLRTQTANCQIAFGDCIPFTVAPKATVYWKAGVNPAEYFGVSSGISFFEQESNALYILGGIGGNVDSTDTDHFDNSVIVHEYGHFLESIYSKGDSPGGSHDANSVIDPRLAWSEGWANFFGLAVLGNPTYRDTYGNSDGSTGYYFLIDLETNTPTQDVPATSGEGNFREFSVTRALWDTIDPHPVSNQGTNEVVIDTVTAPFSELWTIFAGTGGFKSSNYNFRNYGLFMELHDLLPSATDLSSIFTAELQKPTREDYAAPYVTGGTCTYSMTTNGSGEDGSFANSHQFRSNDFYDFNHPGGNLQILVQRTAGAGDLDLYLYDNAYIFGDSSTTLATSHDPASSDGGTEEVQLELAAGHYMINVMLYTTGAPSSADYKVFVNGVELCP